MASTPKRLVVKMEFVFQKRYLMKLCHNVKTSYY